MAISRGRSNSATNDVTRKIDAATAKATAELAGAEDRAQKLKQEGDTLADAYRKLRTRYDNTSALADQLNVLSNKVDAIGEKLGFTPTSKLSSDAKNNCKRPSPNSRPTFPGSAHKEMPGLSTSMSATNWIRE